MRILTINGIRTDGSASTDVIGKRLTNFGHDVVDINYPQVNIFTARSRDRQYENAEYILKNHKEGDAIVAHSYGCLVTLRAMELGAKFSKVFFFGAAMNDDFVFPCQGMKKLYNFHNPQDRALSMGDLLWFHDFGAMGKTGYAGVHDERIENRKVSFAPTKSAPLAHSFYFHEREHLALLSLFIDKEVDDGQS